jgi:hypothetical protein
MPFTLYTAILAFVAVALGDNDEATEIKLLQSDGGVRDDEAAAISSILHALLEEIKKLQNDESSDYRFTKIIFIGLVLGIVCMCKSKVLQVLAWCRGKNRTGSGVVKDATVNIQELNYTTVV